jgi:circadian clock protein KaiC
VKEPLNTSRLPTGVPGLDEILNGGWVPERTYLVRGGAGTGKTTLGVQFLLQGDAESALLITLGEAADQLRENAAGVGLSLEEVSTLDLAPGDEEEDGVEGMYNLLESWEVEGDSIHDRIVSYVRENQPKRVLIDSLSQLRYLTPDTFQYRKLGNV